MCSCWKRDVKQDKASANRLFKRILNDIHLKGFWTTLANKNLFDLGLNEKMSPIAGGIRNFSLTSRNHFWCPFLLTLITISTILTKSC